MSTLGDMLNLKFDSLLDFAEAFPNEEACIKYLEQLIWYGIPVSPFNRSSKVYTCANGKYFCKETKKYFTIKTGTMFENSKVSLRQWFMATYLVTSNSSGCSATNLARKIGVTRKTAHYMLLKLSVNLGFENRNKLSNVVEVDESYVGGKNKNRHRDKRYKGVQGRAAKDKVPVFGMIERDGKLNAFVVNDVGSKTLTKWVARFVTPSSVVMSDEWKSYNCLNSHYEHHIVEHGKGQYVSESAHTNTMEGFWSILKSSICSVYRHVSRKYMQYYVNSSVFRYNTRKMSDCERMLWALQHSTKNITQGELIHGFRNKIRVKAYAA